MLITEIKYVLQSDAEGVATLTLNRPDKLNALTVAMFWELRGHVEALKLDDVIGYDFNSGAGNAARLATTPTFLHNSRHYRDLS